MKPRNPGCINGRFVIPTGTMPHSSYGRKTTALRATSPRATKTKLETTPPKKHKKCHKNSVRGFRFEAPNTHSSEILPIKKYGNFTYACEMRTKTALSIHQITTSTPLHSRACENKLRKKREIARTAMGECFLLELSGNCEGLDAAE